jgi:DNA-directed RNA polymerase subunit RPC12/RpoP
MTTKEMKMARVRCPWCKSPMGIEVQLDAKEGTASSTRCHSCGAEVLVVSKTNEGKKGWTINRRTSKGVEFPV